MILLYSQHGINNNNNKVKAQSKKWFVQKTKLNSLSAKALSDVPMMKIVIFQECELFTSLIIYAKLLINS